MNNLSERVQREFNEWKEKYNIPYETEFQLKTLLKLQEEYDNVESSSNTTKTRETLIHMIQELQKGLKYSYKQRSKMYVDFSKGTQNINGITVYVDNNMYALSGEQYKNISDYANIIKQIARARGAVVYIDANGFGIGLYEELIKENDIIVEKLQYRNKFIF